MLATSCLCQCLEPRMSSDRTVARLSWHSLLGWQWDRSHSAESFPGRQRKLPFYLQFYPVLKEPAEGQLQAQSGSRADLCLLQGFHRLFHTASTPVLRAKALRAKALNLWMFFLQHFRAEDPRFVILPCWSAEGFAKN